MRPDETPAAQPPGPLADPATGHRLPEDVHELARSGLEQAVPFNLHNNVRIIEVGTTYGVAEIPDAPHLKNHLGTQHGAALFAVAEAAAGAAYVGAFLEQLQHIRMNAQEAHITYIHWAQGPITARSTLTQSPQQALQALQQNGRTDLTIPCDLLDTQQTKIAHITFRFHLKQNAQRATV
jgi:acyl-coenzyme A thioesterase PaaI-like protein